MSRLVDRGICRDGTGRVRHIIGSTRKKISTLATTPVPNAEQIRAHNLALVNARRRAEEINERRKEALDGTRPDQTY